MATTPLERELQKLVNRLTGGGIRFSMQVAQGEHGDQQVNFSIFRQGGGKDAVEMPLQLNYWPVAENAGAVSMRGQFIPGLYDPQGGAAWSGTQILGRIISDAIGEIGYGKVENQRDVSKTFYDAMERGLNRIGPIYGGETPAANPGYLAKLAYSARVKSPGGEVGEMMEQPQDFLALPESQRTNWMLGKSKSHEEFGVGVRVTELPAAFASAGYVRRVTGGYVVGAGIGKEAKNLRTESSANVMEFDSPIQAMIRGKTPAEYAQGYRGLPVRQTLFGPEVPQIAGAGSMMMGRSMQRARAYISKETTWGVQPEKVDTQTMLEQMAAAVGKNLRGMPYVFEGVGKLPVGIDIGQWESGQINRYRISAPDPKHFPAIPAEIAAARANIPNFDEIFDISYRRGGSTHTIVAQYAVEQSLGAPSSVKFGLMKGMGGYRPETEHFGLPQTDVYNWMENVKGSGPQMGLGLDVGLQMLRQGYGFQSYDPGLGSKAPVTSIKGIGPAYAKKLQALGISTVAELAASTQSVVGAALGSEKRALNMIVQARMVNETGANVQHDILPWEAGGDDWARYQNELRLRHLRSQSPGMLSAPLGQAPDIAKSAGNILASEIEQAAGIVRDDRGFIPMETQDDFDRVSRAFVTLYGIEDSDISALELSPAARKIRQGWLQRTGLGMQTAEMRDVALGTWSDQEGIQTGANMLFPILAPDLSNVRFGRDVPPEWQESMRAKLAQQVEEYQARLEVGAAAGEKLPPLGLYANKAKINIDARGQVSFDMQARALNTLGILQTRREYPATSQVMSPMVVQQIALKSPELANEIVQRSLNDPQRRQLSYWEFERAGRGQYLKHLGAVPVGDLAESIGGIQMAAEVATAKKLGMTLEDFRASGRSVPTSAWLSELGRVTGNRPIDLGENLYIPSALALQNVVGAQDPLTGQPFQRVMSSAKAVLEGYVGELGAGAIDSLRATYKQDLADFLYSDPTERVLQPSLLKGMMNYQPGGIAGRVVEQASWLQPGDTMVGRDILYESWKEQVASGVWAAGQEPSWKEYLNLANTEGIIGTRGRWPIVGGESFGLSRTVTTETYRRQGLLPQGYTGREMRGRIMVGQDYQVQVTGDVDADYLLGLMQHRVEKNVSGQWANRPEVMQAWQQHSKRPAFNVMRQRHPEIFAAMEQRLGRPMSTAIAATLGATSEGFKSVEDVWKWQASAGGQAGEILYRLARQGGQKVYTTAELSDAFSSEAKSAHFMQANFAPISAGQMGLFNRDLAPLLSDNERSRFLNATAGGAYQSAVDMQSAMWQDLIEAANKTYVGSVKNQPRLMIRPEGQSQGVPLAQHLSYAIRQGVKSGMAPDEMEALLRWRGPGVDPVLLSGLQAASAARETGDFDAIFEERVRKQGLGGFVPGAFGPWLRQSAMGRMLSMRSGRWWASAVSNSIQGDLVNQLGAMAGGIGMWGMMEPVLMRGKVSETALPSAQVDAALNLAAGVLPGYDQLQAAVEGAGAAPEDNPTYLASLGREWASNVPGGVADYMLQDDTMMTALGTAVRQNQPDFAKEYRGNWEKTGGAPPPANASTSASAGATGGGGNQPPSTTTAAPAASGGGGGRPRRRIALAAAAGASAAGAPSMLSQESVGVLAQAIRDAMSVGGPLGMKSEREMRAVTKRIAQANEIERSTAIRQAKEQQQMSRMTPAMTKTLLGQFSTYDTAMTPSVERLSNWAVLNKATVGDEDEYLAAFDEIKSTVRSLKTTGGHIEELKQAYAGYEALENQFETAHTRWKDKTTDASEAALSGVMEQMEIHFGFGLIGSTEERVEQGRKVFADLGEQRLEMEALTQRYRATISQQMPELEAAIGIMEPNVQRVRVQQKARSEAKKEQSEAEIRAKKQEAWKEQRRTIALLPPEEARRVLNQLDTEGAFWRGPAEDTAIWLAQNKTGADPSGAAVDERTMGQRLTQSKLLLGRLGDIESGYRAIGNVYAGVPEQEKVWADLEARYNAGDATAMDEMKQFAQDLGVSTTGAVDLDVRNRLGTLRALHDVARARPGMPSMGVSTELQVGSDILGGRLMGKRVEREMMTPRESWLGGYDREDSILRGFESPSGSQRAAAQLITPDLIENRLQRLDTTVAGLIDSGGQLRQRMNDNVQRFGRMSRQSDETLEEMVRYNKQLGTLRQSYERQHDLLKGIQGEYEEMLASNRTPTPEQSARFTAAQAIQKRLDDPNGPFGNLMREEMATEDALDAEAIERELQSPNQRMTVRERLRAGANGDFQRMLGGNLGNVAFTIFGLQRVWRWSGGAMANWAQEFGNQEAAFQQAGFAAGGAMTPSPQLETIMRRQASMGYFRGELGRAAWNVYGPAMDAFSSVTNTMGQGAANAIVGGLGVGGAMLGTQLAANLFGVGAAATPLLPIIPLAAASAYTTSQFTTREERSPFQRASALVATLTGPLGVGGYLGTRGALSIARPLVERYAPDWLQHQLYGPDAAAPSANDLLRDRLKEQLPNFGPEQAAGLYQSMATFLGRDPSNPELQRAGTISLGRPGGLNMDLMQRIGTGLGVAPASVGATDIFNRYGAMNDAQLILRATAAPTAGAIGYQMGWTETQRADATERWAGQLRLGRSIQSLEAGASQAMQLAGAYGVLPRSQAMTALEGSYVEQERPREAAATLRMSGAAMTLGGLRGWTTQQRIDYGTSLGLDMLASGLPAENIEGEAMLRGGVVPVLEAVGFGTGVTPPQWRTYAGGLASRVRVGGPGEIAQAASAFRTAYGAAARAGIRDPKQIARQSVDDEALVITGAFEPWQVEAMRERSYGVAGLADRAGIIDQQRAAELEMSFGVTGPQDMERWKRANDVAGIIGGTSWSDANRSSVIQNLSKLNLSAGALNQVTSTVAGLNPRDYSMLAYPQMRAYLQAVRPNDMRLQGQFQPLTDIAGNRATLYKPWSVDGFQGRPMIDYQMGMADIGQRMELAQSNQAIWSMGWQQRNITREYGSGEWSLAGYRAATPAQQAGAPLAIRQYQLQQDYQRQGFGIQQRQLDLQWAQFALQREQHEYQYQFGVSEREAGRGFQLTQRGWTREDFGINRGRFETQAGWQDEDFDRNIRFARGRQRIDLMRERDRTNVRQNWQREDFRRTEDRQKQQWGFEDERYQKRVEYEEKIYQFDQRRFDLTAESLNLQQEQLNSQKAFSEEMNKIEDARMEDTIKYNVEQKGHIGEMLALEIERRDMMVEWKDDIAKEREQEKRAMEAWIKWLEANMPNSGGSAGSGSGQTDPIVNGGGTAAAGITPPPPKPKEKKIRDHRGVDEEGSMQTDLFTPPGGSVSDYGQPLQLTINLQIGNETLSQGTWMTHLHRRAHAMDAAI